MVVSIIIDIWLIVETSLTVYIRRLLDSFLVLREENNLEIILHI